MSERIPIIFCVRGSITLKESIFSEYLVRKNKESSNSTSGGLINSFKVCKNNKFVIDKWAEKNEYVINFIKDKKYQAISPVYLVFKKKIKYEKLFRFLSDNEIAYDIKNYRLANPGIRIWTGPTIKKNDLIALTNWLDWCFNKFK